MTGTSDGFILRADDESVKQSILCSALNDYCEKDYVFLSGDEKQALVQRDAVQSMGTWPAADSIAVIDRTLIIKFSTEGEG